MFLFKKKPKSFLGIDVGASAIKLVELSEDNERRKLTNYAIVPLAKYLERTDNRSSLEFPKADNKEIAEAIQRAVSEAKIISRDTFFSIPVYSSFSTLIDFPNMPEKEIIAAIPFEAKKYIPAPISEVVLDWSIIDSSGKRPARQVLLIAVPKKVINNYKEISELAGLTFRGVEEETFSLSRALIGNDNGVIILVDVGARSISTSIIDGGYVRIIHNLEMGGARMTEVIARQMNLSLTHAEALKKNMPVNQVAEGQESRLRGIGYSTLGAIITEVRKIIDSYQNKYGRKVEKCILAGDGIRLAGFADYLTSKLALDVSLGNPFARIVCPPQIKPILKEIGPSLAVATGLAMRGK
ncbi:MAG: type IV pilus assembly protein PilM [Patescibacteria group bacterium]|nr:type IV pilus assembly protein PilM [Patescibacteria group bacterium]